MADILDILGKEQKANLKQIKIIQQSEDYSCAYKKVVFEKHAPLQKDKNKCLFNFQDSLDNLMQRGYSRHPRPNEAFGLLCSYLEGNSSLKNIAGDMLSGYGEWLSLAMKYQNNLLHCYIDPIFEIVDDGYNLKNCFSERIFSFLSLDKHSFNIKEINALNPSFVEFLWSRSFDKLPLEIRNNAYLYLPDTEHIWPAGRGIFNVRYYVYSCDYVRSSRGVRPIVGKNFSSGNKS